MKTLLTPLRTHRRGEKAVATAFLRANLLHSAAPAWHCEGWPESHVKDVAGDADIAEFAR